MFGIKWRIFTLLIHFPCKSKEKHGNFKVLFVIFQTKLFHQLVCTYYVREVRFDSIFLLYFLFFAFFWKVFFYKFLPFLILDAKFFYYLYLLIERYAGCCYLYLFPFLAIKHKTKLTQITRTMLRIERSYYRQYCYCL